MQDLSIQNGGSSPTAAAPRKAAVGQRSTALYVALAALFIIAVAYQARTLEQRFPQWFHVNLVAWPFLLDAEDRPHFELQFLQQNARDAGLREGDALIALNGVSITSRSGYADTLSALHPGDMMDVTFQRRGKQLEEHTRVRLTKLSGKTNPPAVLLFAGMPALCLALGFWVVIVRPRDVRAWLLLALMLSISALFNSFTDFWSPPFRTLATIYFQFEGNSWLGWLFLLGIYFPEPFHGALRWKWWNWLLWTVAPLWAVFALAHIVSFVIELHSIRAAIPINRFIGRIHVVGQLLNFLMVVGFLACIGTKYRMALSADAKRRLRVLYAGTAAGLIPLIVLFTFASLKGVTPEQYFPEWLMATAYLAFLLLPLTLAYVVVVQRAMDVRVVIRQGLQYTLARRGVLILRILLSAALFVVITILMTSHAMRPLGTVAVLAAGLWGIFLLHGATARVAVWVDRRFFRDAYNAEQILSDLAEKVRTVVETQPLLELVTQRIADSLHVKRVAVLLDGSGPYRPAHALGYSTLPALTFARNAATVQVLKSEKQPLRVYFDDTDSWIYRRSEMSDGERSQLATLQSELLLPLSVRDDLIGFMSLGQKRSEAPYSGTDLRLLSSVAAQTGLALEVARLTTAIGSEIAQRERVNRELEIAREVQQHLFPQHFPSVSGLDYSGCCQPARTVGGDYYDFLELPEGKLGIAIGDVSGKGIGAALMMASLGASLRGQASVVQDMTELIKRVSNLVHGASSANRYATFFYAEYGPRNRQLLYVNAGHNPPFVLRQSSTSRQVYRLEAGGGPVIGLFRDSRYEQGSFALQPGDLLVLFTDGISESMNNDDEEWGEERLIDFAKICCGLTAVDAMSRIMTAAQTFADGAPQHDDMTVVVLRVLA
jgi:sigma-B regulation protein RsbU (phosphoserine phosphatase)